MKPKQIEESTHAKLSKWIAKELRTLGIKFHVSAQWNDWTDMEICLSKNLHIQIGNGYYSVVANDIVDKVEPKSAFYFVDGAGKLKKEIDEASAFIKDSVKVAHYSHV